MTRRIVPAALGASLAILAACVPQGSTTSVVQTGMIRPSAAYILPDPGGPVVVGAIQRNLGSVIEHEILLGVPTRTAGQNELSVQVFGKAYRQGEGVLDSGAPTDASVTREMQEVLAGVPMQISPYFVQNRYGPFGYAIGRGKGQDLCIYGWQRLQTQSSSSPFYANRYLLQIRLRLCQTGASEQQLLNVMYKFTLSSHFGTQYPDAPQTTAPMVLSVLDTPTEVRPNNPTGLAYVMPPQAPAPAGAPRAVASAPAAPRTPSRDPAPTVSSAPAVPPPVPGSSGPASSATTTAAAAPTPSPGASGSAPVVPPPDFAFTTAPTSDTGPAGSLSPAMQAITAAREIELPTSIAREAVE